MGCGVLGVPAVVPGSSRHAPAVGERQSPSQGLAGLVEVFPAQSLYQGLWALLGLVRGRSRAPSSCPQRRDPAALGDAVGLKIIT